MIFNNRVDSRMMGGLKQHQPLGFQTTGLRRRSPTIRGLAGPRVSPVMQGEAGNMGAVGQFQLPRAALPNTAVAQPRPSLRPRSSYGSQGQVKMIPGFEGNTDVYIAKQGVVVGRKEKRYVRIRWGAGQKGHKARWVGFAPSDWKMDQPLASDVQLLGFYLKPNLCERSNKSKRGTGWVTLTIDCAHRAIKATIDGWTLGKVFIPTWLMGRVMRPVAVAEAGMPVRFDLNSEEGCEKVLRSGFSKWSTITNLPLSVMRCQRTGRNSESAVLGMVLDVSFDNEDNNAGIKDCQDGYISYDIVDKGLANTDKEIIPLVINDRHAFRVKERGSWDLFYADSRVPLDYISERMTALIRKIYEAKQNGKKKVYLTAVTKLAHFRHILFYLAKNQRVVDDANSRVQWFLSNTCQSGVHKEFTPDLGRLLTCLAVSDYEWEDIAVPFFSEALQRALPNVMKQMKKVKWSGPDCNIDDIFGACMIAEKSLSEMLLHVVILMKIMKPHHKNLDEFVIERLSAEELCCGIAGLSEELSILEYERSARKDEIKKILIKRDEWQLIFTPEQWVLIEGVLDNPIRLRGMLARCKMVAECHGSCGLPTPEMFAIIDEAFELGKSVENFSQYLECYNIACPGDEEMISVVKHAVLMATRKGYIEAQDSPAGEYEAEDSGLLCARQALTLTAVGSGILERRGRFAPVFQAEVLPLRFQPQPKPDMAVGVSNTTNVNAEGVPADATCAEMLTTGVMMPVMMNNVSCGSASFNMSTDGFHYVHTPPTTAPASRQSSRHASPSLSPQPTPVHMMAGPTPGATPGQFQLAPAAIPVEGRVHRLTVDRANRRLPVERAQHLSVERAHHQLAVERAHQMAYERARAWQNITASAQAQPRETVGYFQHPTATPMGFPQQMGYARQEGQPQYVLPANVNGFQLLQV